MKDKKYESESFEFIAMKELKKKDYKPLPSYDELKRFSSVYEVLKYYKNRKVNKGE